MLLRLQKYNLHIKYLPGSQMYIADMLSRAYLQADHSQHENIPEYQIFQLSQEQLLFQEIANINQVDYMCPSEGTHQQIKQCTITDATLQSLMNMIMTGWPLTKEEIPVCIREYWNYKEELTVQEGVLYKRMKVIVPASRRPQMIARAHSSHNGPDACVRRARDVLFWPSMADQIKDQVQNCEVCNDFLARQQKEPLMTHKIPETPWSKVGQDLFTLGDESYLVTVDYFSDYFELDLLSDTTAESVHTSNSPLHSQNNGKAESFVKIAKNLVKKAKRGNKDLQMSLLEWRNTPDSNGLSPVQKLMSRRTRTTIPTNVALLKPEVIDGVYDNIKRKRQQAKAAYEKHAKPLPELQVAEPVSLQPVNPKALWEKDPSQEQASLDISGTNPSSQPSPSAGSSAKSLPDATADPPLNQAPTTRQIRESLQPKSTAVEAIVTSQPQQTVVTRSSRTSVRPCRRVIMADHMDDDNSPSPIDQGIKLLQEVTELLSGAVGGNNRPAVTTRTCHTMGKENDITSVHTFRSSVLCILFASYDDGREVEVVASKNMKWNLQAVGLEKKKICFSSKANATELKHKLKEVYPKLSTGDGFDVLPQGLSN
ncbi:Uncharacterized protein K02A2.6 [Stylophora pistillata]|uniref:Uncharacterized protein K02A2.6 n=1 Tax=Stylophora pistillata TaxID=50429 RepID=A0A2B4SY32_STYPI|nr:Uncharacterized protein K02A2.6 [Stylophora pistillata]